MLGVFDSGLGGLTVLKEIKKKIKNERIIYFGDTARVPWGDKSPETVKQYAEEVTAFLVNQGAKKIVIACNTASALAFNHLTKKFPTIHFYNMITPTVEQVKKEAQLFSQTSRQKKYRLGVIGTNGTINSEAYTMALRKNHSRVTVFPVACPLLVPIVEENLAKSEIAFLTVKKYLTPLKKKKINALILGCTHYPLLKKVIGRFLGPKVSLLEGSVALAEELEKESADSWPVSGNKSRKNKVATGKEADLYWFSDWNNHSAKLAQIILGQKIKVRVQKLGQ